MGEVPDGQHVRIIGKTKTGWNYDNAWDLTSEGGDGADTPVWKVTIPLPRKSHFEYCYTIADGVNFYHVSSIRKVKVKEDTTYNDGSFRSFNKSDQLRASSTTDVHYIASSHHFRIVLGFPQTYVLRSAHPFIGINMGSKNEITEVRSYVQDETSVVREERTTSIGNIHETRNIRIERVTDTTAVYFEFNSVSGNIGKAVVLASQLTTTGNGEMTIPILSPAFVVIGSITFHYSHTTPFVHPSFLENDSLVRRSPFPSSQNLVGHRGSGSSSSQALTPDKFIRSHIRENTILSFTQAGERGATFVEFDVQLTSDLVPVIYHDFAVVEEDTPVPVPVHAVTLDEFVKMGHRQVQKTKTLLDIPANKFTRQPIFDSFPTLRDTLLKVPSNIGFNIEIKYPIKDELEKWHISPVERNTYVDRILWDVFEYAKGRNIYFSSFDPDICLMLVQKQPLYPVLFLSQMGTSIRSDPRCNSPEASIQFTREHGLSGLVCPASFLINHPETVNEIKNAGLIIASWGSDNNNPDNVQKQLDLGLNAVIVDHVAHIKKHSFSPVPTRPLSHILTESNE